MCQSSSLALAGHSGIGRDEEPKIVISLYGASVSQYLGNLREIEVRRYLESKGSRTLSAMNCTGRKGRPILLSRSPFKWDINDLPQHNWRPQEAQAPHSPINGYCGWAPGNESCLVQAWINRCTSTQSEGGILKHGQIRKISGGYEHYTSISDLDSP